MFIQRKFTQNRTRTIIILVLGLMFLGMAVSAGRGVRFITYVKTIPHIQISDTLKPCYANHNPFTNKWIVTFTSHAGNEKVLYEGTSEATAVAEFIACGP